MNRTGIEESQGMGCWPAVTLFIDSKGRVAGLHIFATSETQELLAREFLRKIEFKGQGDAISHHSL